MRVVLRSRTYRRYSKEESLSALYDYAYGRNCALNYILRQGQPTDTEVKISEKLSRLESYMELPILYRATLWNHFVADYKVRQEDLRVGTLLKDSGFMSTSRNKEVPKELYPIDKDTAFIRIVTSGCHRAIDVNALLGSNSPYPSQREILLGKDTQFIVTGIKVKDGITYIDVDIKS